MPTSAMHDHPALEAGNAAVITGGASGIGFAAAEQFAKLGMRVLIVDRDQTALNAAKEKLASITESARNIHSFACDVADIAQMQELAEHARTLLGTVSVLMNNAGIAANPGKPWEDLDGWRKLIDVNLWGVINGVQAFLPHMIETKAPGIVINTGSKQGITRPPGNAAYNMSKAAVIAFTESLAHELRQTPDCAVTVHLLVPGFTYTGMISRFIPQKPDAAWTSEQVISFMLEGLQRGDFYIICPDNDVTREIDARRIQWYADDLIKNRPALSRWHPDYADAFDAFMKAGR